MPNKNQNAQPPPESEQPNRSEQEQKVSGYSRVQGWPRILTRGNRNEIYWKGHSDVMVLMVHSLSKDNAEKLRREIEQLLRRYHDIPFTEPEVSNVERRTVEDHQQTQDSSKGGLEASKEG